MAKSFDLVGKLLVLVGISCFVNTGVSMYRCKCRTHHHRSDLATVRKYALQEQEMESFKVPLDVKVEVLIGLALCVIGLLSVFTTNLVIISGLHYYDCK